MDRSRTELRDDTVPQERVPVSEPRPGSGRSTQRTVIASYNSSPEAQQAVDFLADREFDVRAISIVAEGLSFVEQVTGKMSWGRAALSGLGSGALIGAFIGFIFGIFNFFAPLTSAFSLALSGALFGAIFGLVIGLISYGVTGGRRDFTSTSSINADRFDVTANPDVAEQARQVLRQMP